MTSEFNLLLDEYLARVDGGETFDLEQLKRNHPGHAEALWKQLGAWKKVEGALPGSPSQGSVGPAIHFQTLSLGVDAEDLPLSSPTPAELAKRFSTRGDSIQRYEVIEEIARGAMGAIVRVEDKDLGRDLAMKVVLARTSVGDGGVLRQARPTAVARFVEEARITGRLAHPGIPPVHDFGMDSEGNFYFTMPWVRGETLGDVLARVRAGEPGWDRTRVLGLMLQVCDALAYAHAERVIHRDVKPRNIMVGEFGEVLVMDWGLARDQSRHEVADVRLASPEEGGASSLLTREGVVLGTPCYMSPEQARGAVGAIGTPTDVYAVGAILYELLIGHPPYAPTGSDIDAYGVVRMVVKGPPLEELGAVGGIAPELVAICERAMARDVANRYPDMGALGQDLRAFMEGRVVLSYESGAWVELRKWVGRNRGVAALAGCLAGVTLVGGLWGAKIELGRLEALEYERDTSISTSLLSAVDGLGPLHPASVGSMELWLDGAREAVAGLAYYESKLTAFELEHTAEATLPDPSAELYFENENMTMRLWQQEFWSAEYESRRRSLDGTELPSELREDTAREAGILGYVVATNDPEVAELVWEHAALPTWRYADGDLHRAHSDLRQHVHNLRRLTRAGTGTIAQVTRSKDSAVGLEHETLGLFADAWQEAIRSIADFEECPLYEGLVITPQLGLVPLGRNESGLWEFWHTSSGERPVEQGPGVYDLSAQSGLVLILVPGGSRPIGSQNRTMDEPNFVEPWRGSASTLFPDELVLRTPRLDAYFLSKYEMSQGQWQRISGANPSEFQAGDKRLNIDMFAGTNPVERVTWTDCRDNLARWGLLLPTEAQWEVAARADIEAWFWWGEQWPPYEDVCNAYDYSVRIAEGGEGLPVHDDGHPIHAEVDTFEANDWGFHHILGNVAEWCLDWRVKDPADCLTVDGTGEQRHEEAEQKAHRGGGFNGESNLMRVTRRRELGRDQALSSLGVRPCRKLESTPQSQPN